MMEPGRFEINIDLIATQDIVNESRGDGPRWLGGIAFTAEEVEEVLDLGQLIDGTGHATTYEGKPVAGMRTLVALFTGDAALVDVSRAELINVYAALKGCLGIFSDETRFQGVDLRKMRTLIRKLRPLLLSEFDVRRGRAGIDSCR